jgi:hypothetical protein
LPDNLKPELYDFEIRPYIGTNETYGDKAFTFDGKMNMHFICIKPTRKVIFHSLDLTIDESKLVISSTTDSSIGLSKQVEYDIKREFAIIHLNSDCVKNGKYVLNIVYTGLISSNLFGFYRSSYIENNTRI